MPGNARHHAAVTRPSLATHARRALDEARVPHGAKVLVACSGGGDSQVLLDVLAHVARTGGRISIVGHGVDHGLRAEAAEELALAAALARSHDVPFGVTRVDVAPGGNLQARARTARHRALHAAMTSAGASFVATAHHLDDRAETVVIRLLRGAPLAGLAVLPVRSNELLHPLVRATKSELQAHAARKSIPFARDPSNLDRKHLRVRVRLEVLPLLRELDPRIAEHLVALAEQAAVVAPPSSERDALRRASSSRALAALDSAEGARNPRARILLRDGKTARWDALRGVVITAPCVHEASSRRVRSRGERG